ncbi:putative choline kinase 1 [Hibiscus syriacus]|uniref:Choline kinase 1 n=1 Tax=Hibiscus syriacus TaxID=106335 RepID=A0A6A2YSB9_HIBSY|nr:putative choline kinase 1 [Hibiscus syriacus]
MSKHGQGPKLLGPFRDGRIEEFIHARTLSAADLRDPEISSLIAAKLSEFHNLDMPGPNDVLWKRLRIWLGQAKKLSSPEAAKEFGLDALGDEISTLEKELSQGDQEIGFCHNDLQYALSVLEVIIAFFSVSTFLLFGLLSKGTMSIQVTILLLMILQITSVKWQQIIILTRHIFLDYTLYPDTEERRRFIRAYIASAGNESSDAEVEQLLADAEKYILVNHLFWGLWGIISKALAGLRRINLEGLRWRVFDAKGQVLGRLASQISTVIQGKDKPTYAPNRDDGDMCIVINAKDVCVTGRKLTDKCNYLEISDLLEFKIGIMNYIGHLKERTLKDQMAKDPTEVICKAVLRMLPRNKLRDDRDRKLRIFADSEHPFGDRPIEPYVMPLRKVREMRPRARRALIRAQKKAEEQERGGSQRKGRKKEAKTEVVA